jgi:L,D-transpeptidase ErfK/SrfK
MQYSSLVRALIGIAALFACLNAQALMLPLEGGDVVGKTKTTTIKVGDSLAQIARDNDMGYVEMEEANPGVDPQHLIPGTVLVIPSRFVLPNTPRNGLVINLAEMRLYYYPGNGVVYTHPIGIGREGEDTVVGVFKVIEHIPNPTWTATETMRELRAKEGVILPKSVPPGPDNPMGQFAMRLSKPTYLIHGTNDPLGGIGRRSSSGCMRLYPEDIKALFSMVPNSTTVYIINEPYKAGMSRGQLYLESHGSLDNKDDQAVQDAAEIHNVVQNATRGRNVNIDWDLVGAVADETQGIPEAVGQA